MNVRTGRGHRGAPNRLGQLLGAPLAAGAPVERFRPSLAFIGLVAYLWVIHSAKAPLGTAAIVLALVGLIVQPFRLRLPLPLVLFGLFILWSAVTAPMARFPDITWQRLEDFAKLWLIFLASANVAQSRRQLHILIIAWLGVYALYPVRGTLFNFVFGFSEAGRYAWNFIFANPNDLAALSLPILALCIAALQGEHSRGWIRTSALAGVVVLPALIFLTQSRGGILALLTLGLLVLVEYRRQARSLALGVLAAGVIVLAAPPEVWTRLSNLTRASDTEQLGAVDTEGSAKQRFEIWKVAVEIIADHPVSGVGIGGYPGVHREYALSGQFLPTARGARDTHSIYLNLLAETGLPGFVIFMGMLLAVLLQTRSAAKALTKTDPAASRQLTTLAIGLIAYLQAGLFGTTHRVAFLYLYLGIVASAIVILRQRQAERVPVARQRSPLIVQRPHRLPRTV